MRIVCSAALGVAILALTVPAMAGGFGKAGLWQMTMKDKAKMAAFANMPAQMRAEFAKQGMSMGPNGFVTKFCMTPDDVAKNQPNLGDDDGNCKTVNVKFSGKKYSADIVCTGENRGKGHTELTIESETHYFGTQKMDILEDGEMTHQDATMDARWLGPNCGAIK